MDLIAYLNMTGASTPSPYVAAASSVQGGLDAWSAFSFKEFSLPGGVYWFSAPGVTSANISVDLGAATSLNGYVVYAYAAAGSYSPKDWTFQYSDDNSSWTTIDTQTNQTTWTDGVGVKYTFSAASHRYWRMNVSATNGGNQIGIRQILPLVNASGGGGGGSSGMPPIYDGVRGP